MTTGLMCPKCGEEEIVSAKVVHLGDSPIFTVFCRSCGIRMKDGFTGGFERAERLAKNGDYSGFVFLPEELEARFKGIRDREQRLKDASINLWLRHRGKSDQ